MILKGNIMVTTEYLFIIMLSSFALSLAIVKQIKKVFNSEYS